MYSFETRIGPSSVGGNGKQTLLSMLNLMQDCDMFWVETEPDFAGFLMENGCAVLLAYRQLDILRAPDFGETLSVQSSIFESTRDYGCRNSALIDEDGRPCALSWNSVLFVDMTTGKRVTLPQQIIDVCHFDKPLEMDCLPDRIQLPEEPFEKGDPVVPTLFDVDFNRHVNNVSYVRFACEAYPDFRGYDRIRVEYKKACKRGSVITPTTCTKDGRGYVQLNSEEGKPYCVVEFSMRKENTPENGGVGQPSRS